MAGTTHYRFEITDPENVFWAVVIKDTTYTGALEFDLSNTTGGDGFSMKWQGGEDLGQSGIISSELTFSLDIGTSSLTLFSDIVSGDECRFVVLLYKEGNLYWRGYMLKDEMSKPDAAANVDFLDFKCTDGFGLLKDIDYNGFNINALTRFTFIQWVAKIVALLPVNYDVAGSPILGFLSVWYEANHRITSAYDPLENTLVNEMAFLKVDEYGNVEPSNYYDILIALLAAFNLRLSQWGGMYLFIQPNTYNQTSTRVWTYDKAGTFVSTSLFQLQNTMPQRMAGGSFDYVIPVKEVNSKYEYRQSIYKSNFFPSLVTRGITYNLGLSTQYALLNFSGSIETKFTGAGGTLANICAVYNCTIRNGSHYLKSDGVDYVWTTNSSDTCKIRTASIKSDYPIEQVRITNFSFGKELAEEGAAITFLWDFYRYEYLTTGAAWVDVLNTNTATHESIEGSFIATINTGIPQDGTQLFKAQVSNNARVDVTLETSIIGDGANKYSAGAVFVNNGTSIIQAGAWTIYSEIGGNPLHLNSLQCREVISLRRSTIEIYNGVFNGSPDVQRGFLWEGKYFCFTSIDWNCFNGEYQFSAYAVVVDRASITNTLPATSQSSSSGGGGSSSGGSSTPASIGIWGTAPSTKTSAGLAGLLAKDNNFLYVCDSDNVWDRVPKSSEWTASTPAAGSYYLNKFNGASIDEKIFTAINGRVLGFDAGLNPVLLDVSLATHTHSGYIPYIGGTSNVDLGIHNLTVDTNTLFIDSINHRVGIGTATPDNILTLETSATTSMKVRSTGDVSTGRSLIQLMRGSGAGIETGWDFSTNLSKLNDELIIRQITSGSSTLTRFVITKYGNVGIGTTAPTAVLHLKAGTATANTAPLKFNSGVNLTVVEAGTMEFNGTNLFFTPSTTRKTIAFVEDISPGISGLTANKLVYASGATSIATDRQINIYRYYPDGYDALQVSSLLNSDSRATLSTSYVNSVVSSSFRDSRAISLVTLQAQTSLANLSLSYININTIVPSLPGDPPLGENINYAFDFNINDLQHELRFRRDHDNFNVIGIDPAADHGEIRIGDYEGILAGLYGMGIYGVSIYADGVLSAMFKTNSIQLNCSDVYQTLTGSDVFRAGSLIYSDWYANGYFTVSKTIELQGLFALPYITANYSNTAGLTTLIGDYTNVYNNVLELYSNGTAYLIINDNLTSPVTVYGQLGIDITTGTSPLAVASTTLCTNLNADLLDGLHSSSFVQGGTLSTMYTTESNVTITPTTIHTYNMPANMLTADGQRLEVMFSGISANNTNSKTIDACFGGVSMGTLTNAESGSTNKWFIKFYIVRISSNQIRLSFDGTWNKSCGSGLSEIGGLSFTGTNRIELIVTGVASADITAKLSIVTHFLN